MVLVWSALQISDQGIWRTVVGKEGPLLLCVCFNPSSQPMVHHKCEEEGEREMVRGQINEIYPKEEN